MFQKSFLKSSHLQELADFEKMPDGPKINYQGRSWAQICRFLVKFLRKLNMKIQNWYKC